MKRWIALLAALLTALMLQLPATAEPAPDADLASEAVEEFDPAEAEVPYEYTVDQEVLAAEAAGETAPAEKSGGLRWYYIAIPVVAAVAAVLLALSFRSRRKARRRNARRAPARGNAARPAKRRP